MDPANAPFGGGIGETQILPLTVVLLVLASALILTLPRRYSAIPFLGASLLIPFGQVVLIGGLHFMLFRLLVLVGWVRLAKTSMLSRPRNPVFQLGPIDRAVLWWVVVYAIAFALNHAQFDALINRLGMAYSVLGVYFFMRFAVRDSADADRLIKLLSLIVMLVAVFMVLEQLNGRNAFAIFGGVPETTPIRGGRLRSQGPFAHPILAGTLGASLLPLFVTLWSAKGGKLFCVLGFLGGAVMAFTSASATPLMAAGAALITVPFWLLRRKMRIVRLTLVAALLVLHLVMQAPVWALIARVGIVGGASAYHRYALVDRTILHFSDWWLVGTADLEKWGYLMHDTSNTFVETAVRGGLATLVLFIILLARCFRSIGLARKAVDGHSRLEWRLWAWGAWLLANVVAFFGVNYFDQTMVAWYSLLAAVPVITSPESWAKLRRRCIHEDELVSHAPFEAFAGGEEASRLRKNEF